LLPSPDVGVSDETQPAEFSHATVASVLLVPTVGRGSFCARAKVIYREADRSVAAAAIYGLEVIECGKDTGDLSDTNKTQNGVKSSMFIDDVELERHIFLVLHVTLGIANRLLKDMID
jgi:hypothetical protein